MSSGSTVQSPQHIPNTEVMRFSDVKLGQAVALSYHGFETDALSERVCDLVREWSGSPHASIVSMKQPSSLAPDSLDGRVLARHLDGSNQADVEVLVRAQDVICLQAVVRVALG